MERGNVVCGRRMGRGGEIETESRKERERKEERNERVNREICGSERERERER